MFNFCIKGGRDVPAVVCFNKKKEGRCKEEDILFCILMYENRGKGYKILTFTNAVFRSKSCVDDKFLQCVSDQSKRHNLHLFLRSAGGSIGQVIDNTEAFYSVCHHLFVIF